MWICNFLGIVGDGTLIEKPLILQGSRVDRVKIGKNCWVGHHCVIGCLDHFGERQVFDSEIVIGNNCTIGEYNHITAIRHIIIGNGLLTGRFVYMGDNSHGGLSWEEASTPPNKRDLKSKGNIMIGNNVWIGDKATILGGVTIGDNVIIGAGSVVTNDIPSNCVAVGSPAKIAKRL